MEKDNSKNKIENENINKDEALSSENSSQITAESPKEEKKESSDNVKKSNDESKEKNSDEAKKVETSKKTESNENKEKENSKSASEIAAEAAKSAKQTGKTTGFGFKKKSAEEKNLSKEELKAKKAEEKIKAKVEKSAPKLVKADSKVKEKPKKKRLTKREESKRNRLIWVFVLSIGVLALVLAAFKITGNLVVNGGVAANVDKYTILEADVTDYIKNQTYYKQYSKNSSMWSQFLMMYGMTPSTFREQVIKSKFVHDELVRRACDDENITVSDDEVNEHFNSFKNKYDKESDFNKALENAGYTANSYKEYLKQVMLEKALTKKVITPKDPSDEDVVSYINQSLEVYKDARRSAHILFDSKDTDKANEVLANIQSGAISFEDALNQYSIDQTTKSNGGDRGWDKIESFTQSYNSGLSGLEAGQVATAVVVDNDGIHIVKCLEKWNAPDKVSDLNGIPQAIIDEARTKTMETSEATDLSKWLEDYKSEKNINVSIYSMPEDVPYNVKQTKNNSIGSSSAGSQIPTTTEDSESGNTGTSVPVN